MAILVLASSSGAPGVTTTAVGLALSWPRPVLLVDCDPAATQSILAGFLGGRSANGKGLLRVAEAHREHRDLAEVVIDQALPLAEDGEHSRLFLPGFAKPTSAGFFSGVWADLFNAFERLDQVGIDVIIDAGRLAPTGLPGPMSEHASLVGLVLRSNLRSVISARIYLPLVVDSLAGRAEQALRLLVVGPGAPYGTSEISRALAAPVISTIVNDPQNAGHLSDGQPRPRRFEGSGLARSLHAAAIGQASELERSAERIRGVA